MGAGTHFTLSPVVVGVVLCVLLSVVVGVVVGVVLVVALGVVLGVVLGASAFTQKLKSSNTSLVGWHSELRLHFLVIGLYSKLQQLELASQCPAQVSMLSTEDNPPPGRDPQPATSPAVYM